VPGNAAGFRAARPSADARRTAGLGPRLAASPYRRRARHALQGTGTDALVPVVLPLHFSPTTTPLPGVDSGTVQHGCDVVRFQGPQPAPTG
jgi:hypothetical protein